jgi:hypothetical protein
MYVIQYCRSLDFTVSEPEDTGIESRTVAIVNYSFTSTLLRDSVYQKSLPCIVIIGGCAKLIRQDTNGARMLLMLQQKKYPKMTTNRQSLSS